MPSATLKRLLGPLVVLVLFVVAVNVLAGELRQLDRELITAAVLALPVPNLLLALGLVGLSLLCQGTYDVLALRGLGERPAFWVVAPVGMAAQVIGQNFGAAAFTGGAVRARVWTRLGVPPSSMVAAVLLIAITPWLGFTLLLAIAMSLGVSGGMPRMVGMALWLPSLVWIALSVWGRGRRVFGDRLTLPPVAVALAQVGVSALDWLSVALAFACLLPGLAVGSLPGVVVGVWQAQASGSVSNVPGGIGVFEAALLTAVDLPASVLLPATIAFRFLYFLLPLSVVLLVAATRLRSQIPVRVSALGGGVGFLLGAALLLSAVFPAEGLVLDLLRPGLGLVWIEAGHVGSAVTGALLVVLTRPLRSRSRAAHSLVLGLLILGGASAGLRGLDGLWVFAWTAAAFLFAVRDRFDQPLPLRPPHPLDLLLLAATVLAMGWATWTVYGTFEWSVWATFTETGDEARALRGTTMALCLLGFAAAASFLRDSGGPPGLPGPAELERARGMVVQSPRPDGGLLLSGHLGLLFDGEQGVMAVGSRGRSRVVLNGPYGDVLVQSRLVRAFTAAAIAEALRPAAWDVPASDLPVWLDEGYQAIELGASLIVPVSGLVGVEDIAAAASDRAVLRVFDEPLDPLQLEHLRAVSEAWLAGAIDRGFSRRCFSAASLAPCTVLVVEEQGVPVAFAACWGGASAGPLGVDLVRYTDQGASFLDLLLAGLVDLARAQGRTSLAVGRVTAADVSGFTNRLLEAGPRWEPRYLLLREPGSQQDIRADVEALETRRDPQG